MVVRRIQNDELYHHGVKGQRWGERNGPPYPLNATGKALLKQQKMMEKAEKDKARELNAAKAAYQQNEKYKNSKVTKHLYVDKHYMENASLKRANAINQINDLKMRKVAGDKTVKKDLRNAKRYLGNSNAYGDMYAGANGYMVYVHSDRDAIIGQARHDQRVANKAMKKVEKVLNKYGDKELAGDAAARAKISKSMEKANKALMKIDGRRIASYKKTYGENNAKVKLENPLSYEEMLKRTNTEFGYNKPYVNPNKNRRN